MQSGQPTGHVPPSMHCGGPEGPGPKISQHSWPVPHAGAHVGAAQVPLRHIDEPPLHVVPQPPQLCGSFFVFTHAPPHSTRPFDVHENPSLVVPSLDVPSLVASAPPSTDVVVPPHAPRHMHNTSKAFMAEA